MEQHIALCMLVVWRVAVTVTLVFVPLMLQCTEHHHRQSRDSMPESKTQRRREEKVLATKQSTTQWIMIPSTQADTQGHKAALIASA